MQLPRDYLQDIQKFITSQYWNSGLRITTGVIIPTLVMAYQGWLSDGMSFLFGALFVSLTDSPGPIHHRRNGMLIAIFLNTCIVILTGLLYPYPILLLAEVLAFSFFFSLFGIYGNRAGAVGTLAIVVMLIHMSPFREHQTILDGTLTAAGGLWYTTLSLLLYRLQPYRTVEQALGESLMLIASYIRARASFFKKETPISDTFDRVMKDQIAVLKTQTQLRELLFKTRQFVGDASPKSRSLMMIFLESLDLFEETMYSYIDYSILHTRTSSDLLNQFYTLTLQVVAELEHIGLFVQAGFTVKRMPKLERALDNLEQALIEQKAQTHSSEEEQGLQALKQTLQNIRGIVSRLRRIVRYTRMDADDPTRFPDHELERPEGSEPITLSLLLENLTMRSNYFKYAIRITTALLTGFIVSILFSLSHAYWVMLTIITILKPLYNLTRKRNIQRVLGTLGGVVLGSSILYLISNDVALFVIMITSMLFAYSLLRVNYLTFVLFLTTYILITFHFLNPVEFKSLIGERLVDTLVGSVIAALAARFIFPVWQQYNIQPAMKKMLISNTSYFLAAWNNLRDPVSHRKQYNAARNAAIVALTNLSDNFQQMLAEPGQTKNYPEVHQFVIASHSLTSRISSLSSKDITVEHAPVWAERVVDALQRANATLDLCEKDPDYKPVNPTSKPQDQLHALSMIYSLADDLQSISKKVGEIKTEG